MTYSIDIYLTDEADGFLASSNVRASNVHKATNDLARSLDLWNESLGIGATVAKIYVNDDGGSQVSSYKLKRRETGHFRFVESLEYEIEDEDEEGEE